MQSLQKIRTTSPGFSTTHVLDTSIPLAAAGYDATRAKTLQDELIQRVRALPGVEAAAYARIVPLGYIPYSSTPIAVDGYEAQPNEQPTADYNEVSPGYFATLGIPLAHGSDFITFYFYVLSLECPQALSSSICSDCSQRRRGRDSLEHAL